MGLLVGYAVDCSRTFEASSFDFVLRKTFPFELRYSALSLSLSLSLGVKSQRRLAGAARTAAAALYEKGFSDMQLFGLFVRHFSLSCAIQTKTQRQNVKIGLAEERSLMFELGHLPILAPGIDSRAPFSREAAQLSSVHAINFPACKVKWRRGSSAHGRQS
jgi:hypothetical protein